MFLKNFHVMFISMLIMGTFMAISSNSWFTAWLGLEINLMSMIPLILIKLTPQKSESAIKYFLTQALASIILILSISLSMTFSEYLSLEITELLIFSSLIMKAGIPPFHFWFPQTTKFLNWTQCALIFTWQKIAPFILLTSLSLTLTFIASAGSALVGALGGFNQPDLKLLMTYSSISHSGWMVLSCGMSMLTWLLYFSIYATLSLSVIFFFMKKNMKSTKEIFTLQDSNFSKNILILNMFSLGGLPPLLGFSAKLLVFISAMKMNLMIWMIPLVMSSLTSLFFYSRLTYSNLMNKTKKLFLLDSFNQKMPSFFLMSSLFLNLSLPLILLMS